MSLSCKTLLAVVSKAKPGYHRQSPEKSGRLLLSLHNACHNAYRIEEPLRLGHRSVAFAGAARED